MENITLMSEKKFNIDKNKLWQYNDSLYTEEFVKQLNEERRKANQELLDKIKKTEEEREKELEKQRIANQIEDEKRWANGEIINEFIRRHMEAKITAARWMLALGMAMTFLFKGQWIAWIVFIIWYFAYVNNVKKKALEADKNRKNFGKKKGNENGKL